MIGIVVQVTDDGGLDQSYYTEDDKRLSYLKHILKTEISKRSAE